MPAGLLPGCPSPPPIRRPHGHGLPGPRQRPSSGTSQDEHGLAAHTGFPRALIFLASFGTNFLSSAWERRRKRDDALDLLIAKLPGFNCGLCGQDDCRGFARWLIDNGPAILVYALPEAIGYGILPSGALLNGRLPRPGPQVAFVQAAGPATGKAKEIFSYDGRRDCAAAAACFQGQKACTASCLGFGTCVPGPVPIGAIRIVGWPSPGGSPALLQDAALCVVACPDKGYSPRLRSTAHWQVACNSQARMRRREKAGLQPWPARPAGNASASPRPGSSGSRAI